jgi:hypothetical protein
MGFRIGHLLGGRVPFLQGLICMSCCALRLGVDGRAVTYAALYKNVDVGCSFAIAVSKVAHFCKFE